MVSLLGTFIRAPHTVKHRAQLPDGGDGAQWAQPVDVTGCRVESVEKQYQIADSRVVTLTKHVVMPSLPEVHVGDLLVVDGEDRPVEKVAAPVWIDGTVMHHEVWTS